MGNDPDALAEIRAAPARILIRTEEPAKRLDQIEAVFNSMLLRPDRASRRRPAAPLGHFAANPHLPPAPDAHSGATTS